MKSRQSLWIGVVAAMLLSAACDSVQLTAPTNSRIAFFVAVSFHDGSGSADSDRAASSSVAVIVWPSAHLGSITHRKPIWDMLVEGSVPRRAPGR